MLFESEFVLLAAVNMLQIDDIIIIIIRPSGGVSGSNFFLGRTYYFKIDFVCVKFVDGSHVRLVNIEL
jgi:hypothetical protein